MALQTHTNVLCNTSNTTLCQMYAVNVHEAIASDTE